MSIPVKAGLAVGWCGVVCHTNTSKTGSKLYCHYFSEKYCTYVSQGQHELLHIPDFLKTTAFCNSAITGSVIFNSESNRIRLSVELCQDLLGTYRAEYPRSRSFIWVGGPQGKGRDTNRREKQEGRKLEKMEEEEEKRKDKNLLT